jgi:hypothetical protein
VVGRACRGRDMFVFCLSRRGKIAESDVMGGNSCDWCDAPGGMDACCRSVTMRDPVSAAG